MEAEGGGGGGGEGNESMSDADGLFFSMSSSPSPLTALGPHGTLTSTTAPGKEDQIVSLLNKKSIINIAVNMFLPASYSTTKP